jgi:hypothetical protein
MQARGNAGARLSGAWFTVLVLFANRRCAGRCGRYLRAVVNAICADPDRSLPPPPSSPLSVQPARKTATICKRRTQRA